MFFLFVWKVSPFIMIYSSRSFTKNWLEMSQKWLQNLNCKSKKLSDTCSLRLHIICINRYSKKLFVKQNCYQNLPPWQNIWIPIQVYTHAWACNSISPRKSFTSLLSGVTSNTPTHTFSLSASVFLSWDVCSPSTSICLGFLLHRLWCCMTDVAKCQFILCCWFDITAVSLQADLCQLFIQPAALVSKFSN